MSIPATVDGWCGHLDFPLAFGVTWENLWINKCLVGLVGYSELSSAMFNLIFIHRGVVVLSRHYLCDVWVSSNPIAPGVPTHAALGGRLPRFGRPTNYTLLVGRV